MTMQLEHLYAHRTQRLTGSAVRELLKITENPEIISFAGGLPAPESFPVAELEEACARVLESRGASALQYGATEGYTPLRDWIAEDFRCQGLPVTTNNVLITSGSQQALDLLGKIFINEGDSILVESPTYLGALQAWNIYGAEYISARSDEDGIVTAELEANLAAGPKFAYVLPTFQNPTGVSMPLSRRLELLDLADRFGVPLVEDDPYGQLHFEGEPLPTLLSLEAQRRGDAAYNGNVIYLSTFSKTLAPGIRLAYVIAPEEVIHWLALAKQGADLHSSTFIQNVAYEICKTGFIPRHVATIRPMYRERRDVMLEALTEHMPEGVQWTHPQGGLFLWVKLPKGINTTGLLKKAIENKVAFVPGNAFFPRGGGEETMRLNFSNASPENINAGIARLANVIKRELFGRS